MAGMRPLHDSPEQGEDPWDWRVLSETEHQVQVDDDGDLQVNEKIAWFAPALRVMWPDLADAATQGCLWAMLREVIPTAYVYTLGPNNNPWENWFVNSAQGQLSDGGSLGNALARALLAAWGEAKE
jgi:hypothetical protein